MRQESRLQGGIQLEDLLEQCYQARRVDLRGYKQSSLLRRVERHILAAGCASYQEFLARLHADPEEYDRFIGGVTVGVTRFFRDPEVFTALRTQALPDILLRAPREGRIKVWCPGCATGEEAYTLSILFNEAQEELRGRSALGEEGVFGARGLSTAHRREIRIYATDLDEEALEGARRGLFEPKALKGIVPWHQVRYFQLVGGQHQVGEELRRMIIFGRHDLVTQAPISAVDLLCCRNVLIYFARALQEQVLGTFAYAIRPGGYLVLGKTESLLGRFRSAFRPVNESLRIYQKM